MASDKKKQLIFCGVGVVALVVAAVFLTRSGASDGTPQVQQPDQPVVSDTDSDFDDNPDAVASRSAPTVDSSRSGRLAGTSDDGSAVDEDEDASSVEKKSRRQKKRRPRKKQAGDETDEVENIEKSGTEKVVPRPI